MPETEDYHIIIPARYGSSRLPAKPLLDLGGKPMIWHVVEQCRKSRARSVVVATDNQEIMDAVTGFGGTAVLTRVEHASGSDRIAEACSHLGLPPTACVLNVQGDEPDMPPALIDQVAIALGQQTEAVMATACAPLTRVEEVTDPSIVKVVTDRNQHALYFSRASIPWVRDARNLDLEVAPYLRRHLGIYGYRVAYIQNFTTRPPCALEQLEKLEQLRALWHGEKILCVDAIEIPPPGIDTPEDLERARVQRTEDR